MPTTVTYIHHSGFLVRHNGILLVFDFYSDPSRPEQRARNIACVEQALGDPAVKRVGFFISHRHRDHFDRDVLRWADPIVTRPQPHYFISDDVRIGKPPENGHLMAPNQSLDWDGIPIKTFGSTDAGVSFLVQLPDLRIFHAGDLNWWYWYDESTPQELAAYERDFKAILADMAGESMDIAFFPVDPRLGEYSHHGGLYFIQQLQPRVFFPMHFGYDYGVTRAFQEVAAGHAPATRVMSIEKECQAFSLDWQGGIQ
jgi:L-ascorbate metabolism protein UlaG (beta-lactamase superfamily)